MDFHASEDKSTRRSSQPLEQLEKANDRGMSKRVADCGSLFSYGDAIGDMLENFSHTKMHNIPEFPDKASLNRGPIHEFSSPLNQFLEEVNGKGSEQSTFPFEISSGPDFHTRKVGVFRDYSKNLAFRPRSLSDRDLFSSSRRRNAGRDATDFEHEEIICQTGDIFNERSPPRQFHFQDHRRPAFAKTTQNRNAMEGTWGERPTYRKESLHKTIMGSSGAFSPKRHHMPVTRSKSLGGKPNEKAYPIRGSYGGGSMGGGVMPSLRRQALTNATSLSFGTKDPVPYQEDAHELKHEYRHGMRKPREDNRTYHQKQARYGARNKKPHRLDFIGLLPVLDVPGIDTGEVNLCPSNGCKHVRITDCGAPNGDTRSLEFIYSNPHALNLKGGFFEINKRRINSLSDHPEDEADDEFFRKFRDLESYWNRRRSSPLSRSQWSPTRPQPSIWQPSNEVNFSPFPTNLSNSANPTSCHTPVSLKVPSLSDLATRDSTTLPATHGGDGEVGVFQEGTFRKQEDIQVHHPVLRRHMSDPQGCSTWHPLRSSLRSPFSQDTEDGKRFSYDGK